MKMKRVIYILLIFFSIFLIVLFIKYLSVNRYKVMTPLHDRFLIVEKQTSSLPDPNYDVKLYGYTNKRKKLILYLQDIEDMHIEKPTILYTKNDIKCYLYFNFIIYKDKEKEYFITVDLEDFLKMDPNQNKCFIPIAEEILKNRWEFAEYVSEFLIKSKNQKALSIIQRYAKGTFTKEEIDYNPVQELNNMKKYCRNLLNKYDIKN